MANRADGRVPPARWPRVLSGQRPQPPGAQFVNTVIGLLGAEALPAWSTATMVTVLAPRTSV